MNLSVIQRLLAETPAFFKKVQIFLVSIAGLVNGFSQFLPANYQTYVNIVLVTGIVFCSLAVKDAGTASSLKIDDLFDVIKGLPADVAEVKASLAGKVTLAQAEALPAPIAPIAPPVETQPITNPAA